ncbi:hypothetical protein JOD57_000785 [Geodermatophilus bullaregiensis]|uniref:hypothetical protein n=1 Tax=Geodermatophilus bullaregiensis TaxID=1564160 RepID=UPI00195D9601|nr:hypothetical protein [Geodermatophilus bullaregiensis]MBM7804948.1 hypothetical protein [Geodermatophilus bullaregiensis]
MPAASTVARKKKSREAMKPPWESSTWSATTACSTRSASATLSKCSCQARWEGV